MREDTGNLWTYPADAIVITTNGFVKNNGEAVMGRGCAREAAIKWPYFPRALGNAIKEQGNIVFSWGLQEVNEENEQTNLIELITMPVKHHWREKADIELIKESAKELVEIVDLWGFKTVVMPRPGCGNGQLLWEDVKPILEKILDDRFIAIHYLKGDWRNLIDTHG